MTLKEDIKKILDDYQPRTPSEITKELKKEHAVKSGVNYVLYLAFNSCMKWQYIFCIKGP